MLCVHEDRDPEASTLHDELRTRQPQPFISKVDVVDTLGKTVHIDGRRQLPMDDPRGLLEYDAPLPIHHMDPQCAAYGKTRDHFKR